MAEIPEQKGFGLVKMEKGNLQWIEGWEGNKFVFKIKNKTTNEEKRFIEEFEAKEYWDNQ